MEKSLTSQRMQERSFLSFVCLSFFYLFANLNSDLALHLPSIPYTSSGCVLHLYPPCSLSSLSLSQTLLVLLVLSLSSPHVPRSLLFSVCPRFPPTLFAQVCFRSAGEPPARQTVAFVSQFLASVFLLHPLVGPLAFCCLTL